jgi:hypothetical protein
MSDDVKRRTSTRPVASILTATVVQQRGRRLVHLPPVDLGEQPPSATQPPAQITAADQRAVGRPDLHLQVVGRNAGVDALQAGERLERRLRATVDEVPPRTDPRSSAAAVDGPTKLVEPTGREPPSATDVVEDRHGVVSRESRHSVDQRRRQRSHPSRPQTVHPFFVDAPHAHAVSRAPPPSSGKRDLRRDPSRQSRNTVQRQRALPDRDGARAVGEETQPGATPTEVVERPPCTRFRVVDATRRASPGARGYQPSPDADGDSLLVALRRREQTALTACEDEERQRRTSSSGHTAHPTAPHSRGA